MNHKKLSARIMSFVLSAAMTFTAFPATVFAAEGKIPQPTTTRTITAFDELGDGYTKPAPFDGHTYVRNVELNTAFEEVKLPTELSVTVEKVTTTPPAKDTTDSGEAAKDTTIIETAPEKIPVTWKGDKEYIATQSGKVAYTAELPEGYAVKDSTKLPIINVMVGEKAMAAMPKMAKGAVVKRTTPLDLLSASISYTDTNGNPKTADPASDIKDTGEGWSWDSATTTLTLSGADIDCSGNADKAGEKFGIQLMTGYNIVLADGTTNTVKAGDSSDRDSSGIYFSGGLRSVASPSISGKGTLNVTGGGAVGRNTSFGIYCVGSVLTVVDATINAASSITASDGLGMLVSLDVQSGTITATGTGTDEGNGIYGGDLTMSGGTVTATGTGTMSSGIYGDSLTVTGGTLTASGSTSAVESNSITADGATVTGGTADNASGKFESGVTTILTQSGADPVVFSFGAPTPTVKTRTTPLDLTSSSLTYAAAGGTNKTANPTTASITDTDEGWSWDLSNKTLTLDGANIDCSGSVATGHTGNQFGMALGDEHKIVLTENTVNTVTAGPSNNYDCIGIQTATVATISGKGTLIANGGKANGSGKQSVGISIGGNLTVSEATIIASSVKAGSYTGCGIRASYDLDVQSGTITATGIGVGGYGIQGGSMNMTMSGGNVTATTVGNMGNGIKGRTLTMTGGTLTAFGDPYAVDFNGLTPITATGATVTGTTQTIQDGTLIQTDSAVPVVINFTPSISFDARNGGAAIADAEVDKNTGTIAMPADPKWGNYTFGGWYTEADGKGTAFKNENLTVSTKVYAKWTAANNKTVRTETLDLTKASGDLSGDGWSWDLSNKTLTLSGATIDCSGSITTDKNNVAVNMTIPSNIILTDGTENIVKAGKVTNERKNSIGIYAITPGGTNTFSISGNGTLNVDSGEVSTNGLSIGIYTDNGDEHTTTVSITDSTIIANSGKASAGQSAGIKSTGSIELSNAIVHVTGHAESKTSNGIYGERGLTVNNGSMLSAKGINEAVKVDSYLSSITADGATVTGAKEAFVSGTTKTLTQTDPAVPVVISFGPSISFDARNGGAAIADAEVDKNTGTIAMPADPKWGNYTFGGWYTEADGKGTAFVNSGLTASATLYAKWTKGGKIVLTEPLDLTGASGDLSGDGYKWNNTTKTLTLDGIILDTSKKVVGDYASGILLPNEPCTIILVDGTENIVDVSAAKESYNSGGIFSTNKLTIKTSGNGTPGKLNVIAANADNTESFSIFADEGIVIESGDITATAGDSASGNSIGISTNAANIHIKGGTVTATGGKSGGSGMEGSFGLYGENVQIDNGKVTATGGEAGLSAGIVGATNVTLNGGNIHAKGKLAAIAALADGGLVIDGIDSVTVNDKPAEVATVSMSGLNISTLIGGNPITADAIIKFKPDYTGKNPLAPDKTPKSKTHNTITLNTVTPPDGETVEYGITKPDGTTTWQDSPIFTPLTAGTEYKFQTRVKGNGEHKAGTPSAETIIRTKTAPTTVSGTIKDSSDNGIKGATVTLTPSDPVITTTTGDNGAYTLNDVPEGVYSIVVKNGDVTITETVTVKGTPISGKEIKFLSGNKNTVVESKNNAPDVAVGGMNDLLNDTNIDKTLTNDAEKNAVTNGGSVELKFTADLKTPSEGANDKSEIEKIAGDQNIDLLLDLTVTKTVKDSSGGTVTDGEKVESLADLIEVHVSIPEKLQGKAGLKLYRMHKGKPELLGEGVSNANGDGEYVTTDPSMTFMTAHVKNFSTYALGYNAYSVTILEGGAGASGNGNYSSGDVVTINAGSKSGYSFNGWTVTTGTVTLANPADATTSFVMPAETVAVTASWTSTGGGNNPGGNPDSGDQGNNNNQGGGSYPGGSGSVAAPPPPTTSNQDKTNSSNPTPPTTADVKVPATVDKNGNATVKLSDKAIKDAIDKAIAKAKKNGTTNNGIDVVLNVTTGGKKANTLSLALPKTVLDQIIAGKVLNTIVIVDNPNVSINMTLASIKDISKQANGDVKLSVTPVDSAKLSAEGRKAIAGRSTVDLSMTYANGTKSISNFGSSFTVKIPYTLKKGETPAGLYAVNVDGKKVNYITNSSYDAVAKVLRFTTNRFGIYGIGYKAPTKFTDITNHWAKDSIEFVTTRGFLTGSSKTEFSADSAITMKEFTTALAKYSGKNVSKMIKNSNENKPITRQEMSEILLQFANGAGYKLPQTRAEIKFVDTKNEAVKAMQMAGVVMGKDGNKFDPTGTATKAQASAALRRLVELNLDKATAQGLDVNDSGKTVYYENGKLFTGTKTINGTTYNFGKDGISVDAVAAISDKKYITHKIVRGDSLWKLSKKYKCTVADITKLNDIKNPSKVPVGTEILIPEK